ncbi:MAG: hypothetical protein K0U72_16810 [Gammaproteobacteria bacterium]|nr:hypothetical protein [Gammaproteobacteria bacterium]
MPDFFKELARRKVYKVAIAYLIGAWVVIQIAETVFPNIGLPDRSVTLVIGLVAVGFPLALILSWVFDLTSKGIKRTPAAGSDGPSIAVVPFPDMSAERDHEHFCDGLTEELINVLTCIPGLRVASRTSSFSLKGKQVNIADVAQRFGVEHVLEGSVRKSGDQIRVTAQLIKVADDSHVWSETYDRTLDDIFAIQDDIAACILATLKLKLGVVPVAETITKNPKAYEYFLRGRGYAIAKSNREVELAAEMFLKAVDLDPDFTRAWVCLSEMCAIHAVFFQNNDRWQTWSRRAEAAIRHQLPDSAQSYLASAYSHTACREFDLAEIDFKKVISLDSSIASAYHHLARAQVHQGKRAEAAANFELATERDEEDYESPLLAANSYLGLDDKKNARRMAVVGIQRAKAILQDYPDNQRAYYLGSGGHEILGDLETAQEWTEKALQLNPNDKATQYNAACFYARAGDIDRSLDLLEQSISARAWIENDPDLEPLRQHPRYRKLVRTLPA